MDAILLIRTCFITGVGIGVLFDTIPYLNTRFLSYGPRSSSKPSTAAKQSWNPVSWLDALFAYPVPHHWFLHYYVLSVTLSLFWGYQLATHGSVIVWLASLSKQDPQQSMTLERVWLVWFLLLVQGSRRLYESVVFLKRSSSTMSMSIYLIGLVYYVLDSVGVWIEGSATILRAEPLSWFQIAMLSGFRWAPSVRVMVFLPVFMIASGLQHDAHHYLSSLKKYTLPEHPLFQSLICPHYLMECIIYLSLAFIAAPRGQMVNKTILTTFLFTTVNLGIVAKGAKKWSVEKFGTEADRRWRMIPYIW